MSQRLKVYGTTFKRDNNLRIHSYHVSNVNDFTITKNIIITIVIHLRHEISIKEKYKVRIRVSPMT